jgi:hypothetical protein
MKNGNATLVESKNVDMNYSMVFLQKNEKFMLN